MTTSKSENIRTNRVLDISNTLFNQHGYQRTTMNMIIRESKISRGTVYKYFKDKLDVYETIIMKTLKDQLTRVEEILSTEYYSFQQRVRLIIDIRIDRYQTTNQKFYEDHVLFTKEMIDFQNRFKVKQKEQRLRLYEIGIKEDYINPKITVDVFSKYFDILQAGLSANYNKISLLDSDSQQSLLELIYSQLLINYKTGIKSSFTEI